MILAIIFSSSFRWASLWKASWHRFRLPIFTALSCCSAACGKKSNWFRGATSGCGTQRMDNRGCFRSGYSCVFRAWCPTLRAHIFGSVSAQQERFCQCREACPMCIYARLLAGGWITKPLFFERVISQSRWRHRPRDNGKAATSSWHLSLERLCAR